MTIPPPPGRRFVRGVGPRDARLMYIGEAPGFEEDKQGVPLVGKSGREMRRICDQLGLPFTEAYRTNVVKYRPEYRGAGAGNNAPSAKDIERDEPLLVEEIESVRPDIVVPVGRVAARWLLGDVDMGDVRGLPFWSCNGRVAMRGKWSYEKLTGNDGADVPLNPDAVFTAAHFLVLPVTHPAAGLHSPEQQPAIFDDFQQLAAYYHGKRLPLPIVDQYPQPDYAEEPIVLRTGLPRRRTIAVDTEGLLGRVWGMSYSTRPGMARVVRVEYKDAVRSMLYLIKHNRTVLHNAPHDIPILAEMFGVSVEDMLRILYDAGFEDTMIKSYVLRLLPQALKSLELRLCGMVRPSYRDVVGPADRRIAIEYLNGMLKRFECPLCEGWGETVDEPLGKRGQPLAPRLVRCTVCNGDGTTLVPPPEQIVYERGRTRVSKGWGAGRRIRNILKAKDTIDEDTGKPVDLRTRWESIDEEYRALIEEQAGVMREVSLSDVEPQSLATYYSASDADGTLRINAELDALLDEYDLRQVYEMDRDAMPLFVRMTDVGTMIDVPHFKRLSNRLGRECEQILYKLERLVGHYVNPASSQQVSELLFEEMRLQPVQETKGGGSYSTDDKVLEDLKLQLAGIEKSSDMVSLAVLNLLTDHRERHKLKHGFSDVLPWWADSEGRIHPEFKLTRTESGRPSSTRPNAYNFPDPKKSELGKPIRDGVIARPGCVLLDVDFAQIEVRVLAHESNDPALIAAVMSSDMHVNTAMMLFGVTADQVDEQMRRLSKTLTFAILYGASAPTIVAQLKLMGINITEDQAQSYSDRYRKIAYPGVGDFIDDCYANARRRGYAADMWGRRRYLPGMHSAIGGVRAEAERISVNHVIQAGAAGIQKKTCPVLMWETLPKVRARGRYYCEPLLTVYDSFMFEVAEERVEFAAKEVIRAMTGQVKLRVPVLADAAVGERWGSVKKYKAVS